MRIGSSNANIRSATTGAEISDDDEDENECQQQGGFCPSCRLAVNKDTGRLKWCMGSNDDIWRTRIRYMLLIPAVILPVAIIIIAISKSTVIGKLSMMQGGSSQAQQLTKSLQTSGDGLEDSVAAAVDNDETLLLATASLLRNAPTGTRNDVEQHEASERALHPDAETSFLPAESLIAAQHQHQQPQHRKRDMTREPQPTEGQQESTSSEAWKRWRRAAIGDATASKGRAAEAAVALVHSSSGDHHNHHHQFKASLQHQQQQQEELQVNYSRQQQQYQDVNREAQVNVARSSPRRGGKVQPSDDSEEMDEGEDDDDDSKSEEGEDEEEEEDDDDDDDDSESESEDDEDEEEEDGDSISSSSSSSEERVGMLERLRAYVDEGNRSKSSERSDDESLNFWERNWNEDFIRKSQAKMMLRYMDRKTDPCRDFYQYACGNWQKYNPIPDDKAGFDTFETLRESLDRVLKRLLEEPLTGESGESEAIVKAKNLFRSCMNYEILENRGERPLLKLLDDLGGWPILRPDWDPDSFDWVTLVARLRLYNNDVLISEWVGPDTENSDEYIIQFDQTTLGLPSKDYFLQPVNTIYLMAYKNYLISVAALLGATHRNARIQAEELIKFEIQLANITIAPNERRNTSELYKRMTLDKLHSSIPQIDWQRYLSIVLARPVNYSEPVVLFTMKYLQDLVELIQRTPPRTVANYLFWRFVRHRVNNLDDRFQEAKQTFYYILLGREKSPPRWKNCVAQVNANMGMAVGSIFVRKYFDEMSKKDTLAMTHEIQRAFRELLDQSNWLDPVTKEVASEKVQAMHLRIGYPDFILRSEELDERYKDVDIHPDRYFENTLNVLRHLTRMEQDRLGAPVNKTLWNAAPAIVNAYYSRNKNQIVFPAGILQPPFYHRYFPRSLNYGGIGVVIGHEITHGFDDKGRLFDKHGNLHRWWSKDTIDEFNKRASCLVDQYGRYVVEDVAMAVDGTNTQGENIADNGGIKQAFRAYEKWLSENENANESLPGVEATGRQLFFLNFAQVWCGSMRPEAMRNKLKTAVHSPGRYRVIGTLSNSEEFAKVFNCPLGSPMNPVKKCLVW